MKKALIVVGVVALLLVVAGYGVNWWMGRPLYVPGTVRAHLAASLEPPPNAAEDPGFVTVAPGIRLHYFTDGEGPTAIVLHGGPGFPMREPWDGLRKAGTRYRFFYYHQRGCGASTRLIERFETQSFAQNIAALDQALGLAEQIADIERIRRIVKEPKIVLVGHSFGGLFEQVRRLLPPTMAAGYRDFLSRYFDFRNVFSKNEAALAALNREFVSYYLAAARTKGMPFPLASEPRSDNGGWAVTASYFGLGRHHDYSRAFARVSAPVLIVHGGLDLQPEEGSRHFLEYFHDARFVTLPRSGHFAYADAPEEFAKVVGSFLAGV